MTQRSSTRRRPIAGNAYLNGQLLIAMPAMTDRRFARSVVYMCLHNEEGAMGLIVNQRADNVTLAVILRELGLLDNEREEEISATVLERRIQIGGPVKTEHGFVLHSPDFSTRGSTLEIDGTIRLTNTVEILRAIATGQGPERSLVALGYAGWAPGQLESEIKANGWLSCPADPDLVFDTNLEFKYDRALAKLGVDASHLVAYAGSA
jgi:putative transcriptional regulator